MVNGQPQAYPHTILDWHEVVNEDFQTVKLLTISYYPLTGSAVVFDGNSAGRELTFGVSGLLFNNFVVSYFRSVNRTGLTFKLADSVDVFPFNIKGIETGTTWNLLGETVDGPLFRNQTAKDIVLQCLLVCLGSFLC